MTNERAGWFVVYFGFVAVVLVVALMVANRDLALARAEVKAWRAARPCVEARP